MSIVQDLKRSIRANRRAIKRALPFQGFDPLARRQSYEDDMKARGMAGWAHRALRGDRKAAAACSVFRLVTLLHDPAVRFLNPGRMP